MITSKDYRRRARECLELAHTSPDVFVQVALTELAQEFHEAADEAERESADPPDRRRVYGRTAAPSRQTNLNDGTLPAPRA